MVRGVEQQYGAMPRDSGPVVQPPGILLIGGLIFLSGGITILVSLSLLFLLGFGLILFPIVLFLTMIGLIYGTLMMIVGYAFMEMKPWSWTVLLILQCIGLIQNLFSLSFFLIINIIIILYLLKVREYFITPKYPEPYYVPHFQYQIQYPSHPMLMCPYCGSDKIEAYSDKSGYCNTCNQAFSEALSKTKYMSKSSKQK